MLKSIFPFTRDGRQTLIYIALAGCGPALTLLVMWAMDASQTANQWAIFADLANKVAWALLLIVLALAMFVSIRAIKVGKDGLEASGGDDAAAGAQIATDAAQAATEELKG